MRPLLVTDCDEVLLHMIGHFGEWLGEAHGIDFDVEAADFHAPLVDRSGKALAPDRVWELLDLFFEGEMRRQNVVPGAAEALARIGEEADIVILTNIGDAFHAGRVEQLGAFGISHRVLCNRGGKGVPLAALVAEMQPDVTVFVDDLAVHHHSVAKHAPDAWRLHMIAEPRLAARSPTSPHAHARIDHWDKALPWILARFAEGQAAPPLDP